MDIIVKEEMWRSIGIFWLVLIASIILFSNFLDPSLLTLLILPLLITFIIFLFFVFLRKNYVNGKIVAILLIGVLMTGIGIMLSFKYSFSINSLLLILFGAIVFIYGAIRLVRK